MLFDWMVGRTRGRIIGPSGVTGLMHLSALDVMYSRYRVFNPQQLSSFPCLTFVARGSPFIFWELVLQWPWIARHVVRHSRIPTDQVPFAWSVRSAKVSNAKPSQWQRPNGQHWMRLRYAIISSEEWTMLTLLQSSGQCNSCGKVIKYLRAPECDPCKAVNGE